VDDFPCWQVPEAVFEIEGAAFLAGTKSLRKGIPMDGLV
jgi:hypothetical protein